MTKNYDSFEILGKENQSILQLMIVNNECKGIIRNRKNQLNVRTKNITFSFRIRIGSEDAFFYFFYE